jgi:hypothetical protein
MAKLKIVRNDGSVLEGEITPAVEYFSSSTQRRVSIRRSEMKRSKSDVYLLACMGITRRSGETVKPFGMEFIETLKSVEVLDSDPLA